ncbi:MAG TPA: ABC transporter permease [Ktedonobacteraceae bacterium]|jgi:ribose transport system permease protein|nr:ABC transporter permease [Ktedonobacteraceae bacterium]
MIKSSTANTVPMQLRRILVKNSYLLALLLLIIAVLINYLLQPNFFLPGVLNGNLQTYLPLLLLAVGQAIIIVGGGIDLSIGSIVSLTNVIVVHALGNQSSPSQIALAIVLGLLAGLLAGAFNGFCVAYLRFQPIITTFATSFVFLGLAEWVMPSPGGTVPADLANLYTSNPLGISFMIWVIAIVLILWGILRSTRFGPYLYAVGGRPMSAYQTGVPVSFVRLSSYALGGLMAGMAGLALALTTGSGDPLIGSPMTLDSITAVVLGGTRLSGGQGGILGSILGVLILGVIRSIISFANVPTWWQTLVNGIIVILALAGPGLVSLIRRQRA